MEHAQIRRLASRAAANLVAVVAISAIFGLKAYIDIHAGGRTANRTAAEIALASGVLHE